MVGAGCRGNAELDVYSLDDALLRSFSSWTYASLFLALVAASQNIGMATAARMPMIATTIISSINVNPRWAICFIFIEPSSSVRVP